MYAGTAYAGTFSAATNSIEVSSIDDMVEGQVAQVRDVKIIIGELVSNPGKAWINGSALWYDGYEYTA